jgi:hypothetical protein
MFLMVLIMKDLREQQGFGVGGVCGGSVGRC